MPGRDIVSGIYNADFFICEIVCFMEKSWITLMKGYMDTSSSSDVCVQLQLFEIVCCSYLIQIYKINMYY